MRCTFDNFVAPLKCPNCGAVAEVDDATMMATHIREEPEMASLGIGDKLKVDPMKMRESGYLTVRQLHLGEGIHILQDMVMSFV